MDKYKVTGMSCAACQAHVEKAVSGVKGVSSCTVSLLTNTMGVEGDADPVDIEKAVKQAGYGAKLQTAAGASFSEDVRLNEETLADTSTPVLKKCLISSLCFLIVIMYFSMGHMMLYLPLPGFLSDNPVSVGMIEMLLTIAVMIINKRFYINGLNGIIHGSPNMDTLVALGSAAAFGYSLAELFMMSDAQMRGNTTLLMHYSHNLYFESAAMILTLITVGKLLESISKGRTTDALKSLLKLAPKTAVIVRTDAEGKEIETKVGIDELEKGDIFAVRPGEAIPADGIIISGSTSVNEAALTGESIPADKNTGDRVSAATINASGYIRCRATGVGEDTSYSEIIRLVSDAAATKAPVARAADKVSAVFVPVVMLIAAVTFVVWLLLGRDAGYAIVRAVSVLVISCPCALGLATPVAVMVGNGVGAKNGILFKTAEVLEETGKINFAVFDKTGTLTSGKPSVTDVVPASGISEAELADKASALEAFSSHPLAGAIVRYQSSSLLYTDFEELPGHGVRAFDGKENIYGGNAEFISSHTQIPENMYKEMEKLTSEGKTPLLFSNDSSFLGMIAVMDTVRDDAAEAVEKLKKAGINVVMLTGDNERTAQAIGRQIGVDTVIAGVLPSDKEREVRKLRDKGIVMMTGDGINDAPALAAADIGVAVGNGTDAAIDSADVILMKNSLRDVPAAVNLSRYVLKNIHENLFWAFFYNIIGIPLAAGCYEGLTGWTMSPAYGAAAMSISSFIVVMNALRINFFKLYEQPDYVRHGHTARKNVTNLCDFSLKKDISSVQETDIKKEQENKTMQKTVKIEGMMCAHCEATVRAALESLDGVERADVSHDRGDAVITESSPVDDAIIKKAVEEKGYKVV